MKPLREAPKIGVVLLAGIAVVLVAFLVITMVVGDSTDQIGENQSPAPASPRPS